MDRFEMYKNAKLAHMILSQQIPESSRELVCWLSIAQFLLDYEMQSRIGQF